MVADASRLPVLILAALGLMSGAASLIWSLRSSDQDFIAPTPWRKQLLHSGAMGIGIWLMALSGLAILIWLNGIRQWALSELIAVAALGLGVVILIVLGSLWQYFLVDKLRGRLLNHLKSNKKM